MMAVVPNPTTIWSAMLVLGVQQKMEERGSLALLADLFPGVSTLAELRERVAESIAFQRALDTITNADLSLEQTRAKLQEMGAIE